MAEISAKTTWKLARALRGKAKRATAKDGVAVVSRVGHGTVWVRLPGSSIDTPVNGTRVADASVGESVIYHIDGGKLSVTGNATSPSMGMPGVNRIVTPVRQMAVDASDTADHALTAAKDADDAANAAAASALSAANAAQTAWDWADDAMTAAGSAQTSADNASAAAATAQASADSASAAAATAQASADSALVNLSVVEDVAGTLTWISEHGTFTATTDTSVVPGRVYFELVSGDYVPIAQPSGNPASQGWYVLDVTESQTEYVMSHLAVTSAGLWVLPSGLGQAASERYASGYKVLLSSSGMTVYDGYGGVVATYGSSVSFAQDRDWSVGSPSAFIAYNAAQNTLQIGGAGVTIGGKAPGDILTSLDVTVTQTSTGAEITVNGNTVSISNGTSVTILGSYNTLAELQAAHPTGSIGDGYMVAGDLYVWNGSAWEDVGSIQGPQGPQGATGPQGAAGPEAVVSISATSINWASGTATLQATLRVNGSIVTSGVTYSWTKGTDATVVGTSRTITVNDLDATYNCTCEW